MDNNVKIQGWLVDDFGFILESIEVETNKDTSDNEVIEPFPIQPILVKPRWVDGKWIEGATKEEIDEIMKPQPIIPTDTEILGQQMTEREIESMIQGQQITDMELRLIMLEAK